MRRTSTVLLLALTLLPKSVNSQNLSGITAAENVRLENRPRAESLAGHGIDMGTGAFVLSEEIIWLQGLRRVDLTLNYNSLLTGREGAFGRGWSHPFEAFVEESGDIATVHWDVNRQNRFRRLPSGQYEALEESSTYDRLSRSGSRWIVEFLGGSRYEFRADGKLERMVNRVGQEIRIDHGSSGVSRVLDVGGSKSLSFIYSPGSTLVRVVEDNADRLVYFDYGVGARLRSVRRPATMGLAYGTNFAAADIPDNGSVTRQINVSNAPARIGLARMVTTQIAHSRPSDLEVTMTSPAGTTVRLTTNQTSSSWLLGDTVLTDFEGENPNGTWILRVSDQRSGQTGRLTAWRLRFTEPTDEFRYEYNSAGQITAAFDPDGRRLFANTYDAAGRIVSQDDGRDDNAVAQVSWRETGGGVIAAYRNRTGATTTFEHDARYRLIRITNPLDQTTRLGYNSRGDRTSITDPLGRTTRLTFSEAGYPVTYVNPAGFAWSFEHNGPNLTSIVDPLGKRSVLEYSANRVSRVKDPECLADNACAGVRKSWGGSGEMMSNTMNAGGMVGYTWQGGRPVGATHPVHTGRNGAIYDAAGRLIEARDPDGNVTRNEYDSANMLISQTDPLGNQRRSIYDRRGRPVRFIDALGNATANEYDGNGNVVAFINALGERTLFEYDGEDRLVRTRTASGSSLTRTYDAAGRPATVTDGAGVSLRYEYDAAGNHTATYDSDDRVIESIEYDDRDLPVARVNALGARQQTEYDELGRVRRQTRADGGTETLTYDRNDRPTAYTDAGGRVWRQRYNLDNLLTSITDPGNQTTRLDYDRANRLTSLNMPDGLSYSFGYTRGEQPQFESIGDVTHEYSYDAARRLREILRDHNQRIQFDRDANGNATAVRSGGVVRLRYEYDGLGRVRRFTDAAGNSLLISYSPNGLPASVTYPGGQRVRYVYDSAERLTEIIDWADRRTRYSYDKKGRPLRIDLPNGVVQEFEFDAAGRVVRRTESSNAGLIQELRFAYDALDRPTQSVRRPDGAAFLPQPVQMTYGNGHALSRFDGQSVTHDRRGNVTLGPLLSAFGRFSYDLAGNLVSAGSSTYTYDEQDRLVATNNELGSTRFFVNPATELSQILVRTAPNGTVTRYVWGPGLVYEERAGRIRTYHYDYSGNTVAIVNDSGAVAARMSYGPFGEVTQQSGDIDTPFRFGGLFGLVTDSNGLVYMRYRWYSPRMRRFLSKDSEIARIGFGGSTNPYGYAAGDPINSIDPSGRIIGNIIAGAVVGAIVNVAARTVISLATTGKPPTWGQIAGAALDGALAGAALATCGPPCATFGGAVVGGAIAGAGGAFFGSLLEQGIDRGSVDFGEAGVEAAWGAGFGAVGGGIGAGRGGKAFTAGRTRPGSARFDGGSPADSSIRASVGFKGARTARAGRSSGGLAPPTNPDHFYAPARMVRTSVSAQVPAVTPSNDRSLRAGLRSAGKDWLSATTIGYFHALLFDTSGGEVHTQRQARAEGIGRLQPPRDAFGFFPHWRVYVEALRLGERPVPDPAPALGVF